MLQVLNGDCTMEFNGYIIEVNYELQITDNKIQNLKDFYPHDFIPVYREILRN